MERKQLLDTINLAIAQALADVHTVVPVKVERVNAKTIDCKPVVARLVDGETIELPVFADVPPVFMQGGSSYTAHPITAGDYGLLLVTERCFDRWYYGADNQPPLELRMHDYSDGFYLGGIKPAASAITIPLVIEQVGDIDHAGNLTRTGALDQTGDASITGNVEATSYSVGGTPGMSGTFLSNDGKTVTVTNGIVTGIV